MTILLTLKTVCGKCHNNMDNNDKEKDTKPIVLHICRTYCKCLIQFNEEKSERSQIIISQNYNQRPQICHYPLHFLSIPLNSSSQCLSSFFKKHLLPARFICKVRWWCNSRRMLNFMKLTIRRKASKERSDSFNII